MGPAHCPCPLLLPDPAAKGIAMHSAWQPGRRDVDGGSIQPISLPHVTCGKTSGLSSGQGHSARLGLQSMEL